MVVGCPRLRGLAVGEERINGGGWLACGLRVAVYGGSAEARLMLVFGQVWRVLRGGPESGKPLRCKRNQV